MVQRGKHCNHLLSRDFSYVLFCRVNGLKQSDSGKGLVPALITLILMTLVTERGLSSTARKPTAAVARTASADTVVPAFMDSL